MGHTGGADSGNSWLVFSKGIRHCLLENNRSRYIIEHNWILANEFLSCYWIGTIFSD